MNCLNCNALVVMTNMREHKAHAVEEVPEMIEGRYNFQFFILK